MRQATYDKLMWLLITIHYGIAAANFAMLVFLIFFKVEPDSVNYQQQIIIGEGNCHVETTIEVLPELVDMGVLKWLNACFATQKGN